MSIRSSTDSEIDEIWLNLYLSLLCDLDKFGQYLQRFNKMVVP